MDIYLKMVTNRGVMVKGGSKETDHVDWIEVLTFDQVHYGGSTASPHDSRNEIMLTTAGIPRDLLTLHANGAVFPAVILDMPTQRVWYVFREAFISQLLTSKVDAPVETITISLHFTGVEVYYGAYAPTAAAVQAGKVLISVGLAKLRRFLTK